MQEGNTEKTNKLINVLRWILFFPLSLIGSWLIDSIIVPFAYTGDFPATTWAVYLEILSSILRGFVLILVAYIVIPKKKKIVLLIYSILCSVYAFAFSFIEEFVEGIADFGWFEIVLALVLICSIWTTYFVIQSKVKNNSSSKPH